jgi:hypothetical protein
MPGPGAAAMRAVLLGTLPMSTRVLGVSLNGRAVGELRESNDRHREESYFLQITLEDLHDWTFMYRIMGQ